MSPSGPAAPAIRYITLKASTMMMSARDETEEIGNGTHERMVVDLVRLGKKLTEKKRP